MPGVNRVGLYWRTLRHLRPVQLYGRLAFKLARPRIVTVPAPPLRRNTGPWVEPSRRPASLIGPGQFRLLNLEGDLRVLGWTGDGRQKLWRYNQHYFDDLNAQEAEDRAVWHCPLIEDWVARNAPGHGDGWEPYPTSLRIVNWIKWALAGNVLSETATHSLAIQARWLIQRLERHLLGNHLFANAKALVFAGLFFDGPEARVWLNKGLSILRREVPEQILPDGGQFELSPMYHALALEDVLDLINVMRCFSGGPACEQVRALLSDLPGPMQAWLNVMCHPDGEIAFFNDGAFGVAPSPAELHAYATRLAFPQPAAMPALTLLEPSGYARINRGRAALIADVARVGPDYLPAHAHADTLSFELSLEGRRLVVNSGTSIYGDGEERIRQRGTAAHSALVLDGLDSSEVWGGFRVGRRAKVFDIRTLEAGPAFELEAAHNGYSHLVGRPVHRRRWSLSETGLVVTDEIRGTGAHDVSILFHFGPDVAVTEGPGMTFRMSDAAAGRELAMISVEPGSEAAVIPATWHPGFGCSRPIACLRIRHSGVMPFRHTTVFRWSAV